MIDEVASLENEAEATRDRIAVAMDDLQHRLSPRTIVNNAVGAVINKLGAQGTELVSGVSSVVRRYPIATTSAALTVALLAIGRSRTRGAKIEYQNFSAYPEYDDGYGANSVDDRWADDQPRRPAIGSNRRSRIHDNPIASVVVGVAAGALLGALLPTTIMEQEFFDGIGGHIAAAGDKIEDGLREIKQQAAE